MKIPVFVLGIWNAYFPAFGAHVPPWGPSSFEAAIPVYLSKRFEVRGRLEMEMDMRK
jgi:hypothetical protein